MSLQPVTCCGYGTAGTKTLFDCLIIPGAQTVNGAAVPVSQCGGGDGVYGGAATPNFATTTVCSKCIHFQNVILFRNVRSFSKCENCVKGFVRFFSSFRKTQL